MEAAVEERVMLLFRICKKARLKVLDLGNYYSCRVRAVTCEIVSLSGFVDCLFLSSFQCIADMECGG